MSSYSQSRHSSYSSRTLKPPAWRAGSIHRKSPSAAATTLSSILAEPEQAGAWEDKVIHKLAPIALASGSSINGSATDNEIGTYGGVVGVVPGGLGQNQSQQRVFVEEPEEIMADIPPVVVINEPLMSSSINLPTTNTDAAKQLEPQTLLDVVQHSSTIKQIPSSLPTTSSDPVSDSARASSPKAAPEIATAVDLVYSSSIPEPSTSTKPTSTFTVSTSSSSWFFTRARQPLQGQIDSTSSSSLVPSSLSKADPVASSLPPPPQSQYQSTTTHPPQQPSQPSQPPTSAPTSTSLPHISSFPAEALIPRQSSSKDRSSTMLTPSVEITSPLLSGAPVSTTSMIIPAADSQPQPRSQTQTPLPTLVPAQVSETSSTGAPTLSQALARKSRRSWFFSGSGPNSGTGGSDSSSRSSSKLRNASTFTDTSTASVPAPAPAPSPSPRSGTETGKPSITPNDPPAPAIPIPSITPTSTITPAAIPSSSSSSTPLPASSSSDSSPSPPTPTVSSTTEAPPLSKSSPIPIPTSKSTHAPPDPTPTEQPQASIAASISLSRFSLNPLSYTLWGGNGNGNGNGNSSGRASPTISGSTKSGKEGPLSNPTPATASATASALTSELLTTSSNIPITAKSNIVASTEPSAGTLSTTIVTTTATVIASETVTASLPSLPNGTGDPTTTSTPTATNYDNINNNDAPTTPDDNNTTTTTTTTTQTQATVPPGGSWWGYKGWSASSGPHPNPASAPAQGDAEKDAMKSREQEGQGQDIVHETVGEEQKGQQKPTVTGETEGPVGKDVSQKTLAPTPTPTTMNENQPDLLERVQTVPANGDGSAPVSTPSPASATILLSTETEKEKGASTNTANEAGGTLTWLSPWAWYPGGVDPNANAGTGPPNTTSTQSTTNDTASSEEPTKGQISNSSRDSDQTRVGAAVTTSDAGKTGNHGTVSSSGAPLATTTTMSPGQLSNATVVTTTADNTNPSDTDAPKASTVLPNTTEPPKSSSSAPTSPKSSLADLLNPVQLTIQTNRSGWASFWSSKSLLMKTVAGPSPSGSQEAIEGAHDENGDAKKDAEGMEVMYIDDEEEGAGDVREVATSASAKTTSTPTRGEHDNKALAMVVRGRTAAAALGKTMSGGNGKKLKLLPAPIKMESPNGKEVKEQEQGGKSEKSTPIRSAVENSSKTPGSGASTSNKPAAVPTTPAPALHRKPSNENEGGRAKDSSPAPSSKSTNSTKSTNSSAAAAVNPKSNAGSAGAAGASNACGGGANLVLPTWDDTFYSAPRSIPPPRPPTPPASASPNLASPTSPTDGDPSQSNGTGIKSGGRANPWLGGRLGRTIKTMKLVGEVLFAKDLPDSIINPSPNPTATATPASSSSLRHGQREALSEKQSREEDYNGRVRTERGVERPTTTRRSSMSFAEYGHALPKTWDLLDAVSGSSQQTEESSLGSPISVISPSSFTSPVEDVRSVERDGIQGAIDPDVLRGCKRVVVIGVHGWFPGAVMRTVIGEPTGTSSKLVNMMVQAIEEFQKKHGVELEKITKIPLEGEGTIKNRVDKLYTNLLANHEWMNDLHTADAIFVATHSQGSIVSTHLLDNLVRDGHIRTLKHTQAPEAASSPAPLPAPSPVTPIQLPPRHNAGSPIMQFRTPSTLSTDSTVIIDPFSAPTINLAIAGFTEQAHRQQQLERQREQERQEREKRRIKHQRVCCLALCGIHLGPLRYLKSSAYVAPYIQYFENTAARELFEFQNTESNVSKAYVEALKNVLDHSIKMVYVASLNDQVVPLYSGLFTAASHPLILRALYIDGDAYHSSDFLSNLLVLLLRILNSGLSDSGLLTHLSEATAGSLNGVGHSTAYEEIETYSLAVKYLFLTNDGCDVHPEPSIEPFNALSELNDYEIPWSLRDLIADPRISHFFSHDISQLRDAFRDWHPKTTILRDIKRKLQPIQRLPTSFSGSGISTSKL